MNNFKKIISPIGLILLAGLILSACGSTPNTETHYFVLTPSQINDTTTNIVRSDSIVLQPIQLAKFLDQSGIVLQTDQHEIKVAHFHRWAEPLKKNLHRYISQSMRLGNTRKKVSQQEKTLEIHFQQFQGTQDGTALVSGYWKIDNTSQPFSYQAPLTKTGYTELVKQLALLLDQLCTDITKQIN